MAEAYTESFFLDNKDYFLHEEKIINYFQKDLVKLGKTQLETLKEQFRELRSRYQEEMAQITNPSQRPEFD
uniref:Uncharacterized protein n=1 Tax=Siphoviridae sp. ctWhx86 TaxID=2826362 RepID=A0A8S5QPA4_9CAUD|nr:MAG TPA: hypothetical protein [Siphoviridae sp. ctWhx86]